MGRVNQSGALGVLKSAKIEYEKGLAIEYHLSVTSAVFGDLLDQSDYLLSRGYGRAAAVLFGAALEDALKSRAKAIGIDVGGKTTLNPLIQKFRFPEIALISGFEAENLEAVAKMRNDAAHAGEFEYPGSQIAEALECVRRTISKLLN